MIVVTLTPWVTDIYHFQKKFKLKEGITFSKFKSELWELVPLVWTVFQVKWFNSNLDISLFITKTFEVKRSISLSRFKSELRELVPLVETLTGNNYFRFPLESFKRNQDIWLTKNSKWKRGITQSKFKSDFWGLVQLVWTITVNNYFKLQVKNFDSNWDIWLSPKHYKLERGITIVKIRFPWYEIC